LVLAVLKFCRLIGTFSKFIISHFLAVKFFESSNVVLVCVLEGWNLEHQVGPIFFEFPQPKDPSSVLLCLFRSFNISIKVVVFPKTI
jgi:hypothetical protein